MLIVTVLKLLLLGGTLVTLGIPPAPAGNDGFLVTNLHVLHGLIFLFLLLVIRVVSCILLRGDFVFKVLACWHYIKQLIL